MTTVLPTTVKARTPEAETLGNYRSLCGRLEVHRLDVFREAHKSILPFVQGLRFSALLTYEIRKALRGSRLTASWGVILANDPKPSPECDIIIHHEDDCECEWNGGDDLRSGPVMHFRFIKPACAKLVISCKSTLRSIHAGIKRDFWNLAPHVGRVWLFAECCGGNPDRLGERAKQAGYERFWWLYSEGGVKNYNEPGWFEFVKELKKIGK